MAKKNIEGQLDMFELFDSVEELEEHIKGVPEMPEACGEEEKTGKQRGGVPEMPETSGEEQEPGTPVMQKSFLRGGETATVAYLDYHMVYVADWGAEPVIRQFGQSKDAVDFYVERLEHFSSEKQVTVQEQQEPLKRARVRKWTGDGEDETGDTES